jgi:hypothetical protein
MEGDDRWTIHAFDSRKANKKETPALMEYMVGGREDEYTPILGAEDGTAYICAWCDKDQRITKFYKNKGLETSHGICKKHFADMKKDMGIEESMNLKELIFHNNAGVMEVFRFFEEATNEQKTEFDSLINAGNQQAAWSLIEKVLSVKFQGDGPWVPGTM